MRAEQQLIREWADGQGEQNREIRRLLERLTALAAKPQQSQTPSKKHPFP